MKGAIKVELYTDDPDRRFVPGAVFRLQVPTSSPWHGKTLELVELKWYNSHAVAFFTGVPDRSVAETLIKAILWVDQDDAETADEDDAWYDHQLVGLAVHRDGVRVGTVSRIDHFPAQDLLTVATESGDVLVPFVKAIVPSVDVAGGVLTVTPPLGLFEELPDQDQDQVSESADDPSTAEGAPASDAEVAPGSDAEGAPGSRSAPDTAETATPPSHS